MESVEELNVPNETGQPISNIMQTLKTIMLSLQLIDEKCFQSLVLETNYRDIPCLKLVSKNTFCKIVVKHGAPLMVMSLNFCNC